MADGRRGRRSKLTPERRARLLDAIRSGAHVLAACQHAGIGTTTYYEWMKRGEAAPSGPYRELYEAVLREEAELEVALVAAVQAAGMPNKAGVKPDWKAAAWLLSRRFPERWGKKVLVESEERPVPAEPGGPSGEPRPPRPTPAAASFFRGATPLPPLLPAQLAQPN